MGFKERIESLTPIQQVKFKMHYEAMEDMSVEELKVLACSYLLSCMDREDVIISLNQIMREKLPELNLPDISILP